MASSLAFRTALAQIEAALHRVIRWALLPLNSTVATVAALKAVATQASGQNALPEFTPIFVTASGKRWEWLPDSTATADDVTYAQPDDVTGAMQGRWHITTSAVTGGYLAAVHYWSGETTKEEYKARSLAARPAVVIIWDGSTNDPRSNIPGAVYDYQVRFSIWCVDENLRPRFEVFLGSDYGADSAHPGVIAILGDVKKALADQNKIETTQGDSASGILSLGGGVKVIALGEETMEDADLDARLMIMSLAVEVFASVENPDSDSEHVTVTSVYVQPQLTALNQQTEFDSANYVVSGYLFAVQTGLTSTPSSGSAVIGGVAVSSSPVAHTFTEYTDTYCDLKPDGTITYVAALNGGAEPAVTATALRLGKVVTDSVGITEYDPIAAVSAAFGPNRRVIPDPGVS